MAQPTDEQQKERIWQFSEITGATQNTAIGFLSDDNWDVESAVTAYFTSGEADPPPNVLPATSNMPPPPPVQLRRKKYATLGDLGGAAGSHSGHGHDGDKSDDGEDNQNLYAGGEKSGLAVANPDDLKKKIIERAKNVGRSEKDETRAAPSHFKGAARTLGGDDAPSEIIEDPNANQEPLPGPVERRLHFWADGFSVDDGPLYRNDDPSNTVILEQIKKGHAPLSILNVRPGQEVDVRLEQHTENYVKPKPKYKPFSGGGQRLGSPTPGVTSTSNSNTLPQHSTVPAASFTEGPSTLPADPSTDPPLDPALPIIRLQVRLGDGTRLTARFNPTHTVGDVYQLIDAASTARPRPWVLMTTFPSTELTDREKKLGDLSETKRGGTVIQKWK